MDEVECPECHGSRLKKEAMYFRIHEKNIFELSTMDISELSNWFEDLDKHLSEKQKIIANREDAYSGSRMQFIRALINNDLDGNGFSVYDAKDHKSNNKRSQPNKFPP